MEYAILGNGYVGGYLAKALPDAILLCRGRITQEEQIEEILDSYQDAILINCMGKTGRPNVDWCESHKMETFEGNVTLPIMIAEVCKAQNRNWIHIGSGCVYTGYEKEWTEEDVPNFLGSFYSQTKAWSQYMLKDYSNALVLRIRMPIDEDLQERCYISKIVKYAKAGNKMFDMLNSMTILSDLAKAIEFLTEKGLTGEYNVVNKEPMVISNIFDLYKKLVDPSLKYEMASYEEVRKTMVADRSNCVLSTSKLEKAGFEMSSAYMGLQRIMGIVE